MKKCAGTDPERHLEISVVEWPVHPGITVSGVCQLPRCSVALRFFRSGFALTGHTLDRSRIDLTLRGSAWLRVGREEQIVAPGTIMLRPGLETVSSCTGPDGLLQFSMLMSDDLGLRSMRRHPRAGMLLLRAHRAYSRADDTTLLTLESLAAEIRAVLAAERDVHRDSRAWLGRTIERLRADPMATPTLDALAVDAGVHFTTLARGFRRTLRCTPGDYLRALRLELAAGRLARTTDPISAIAMEHGFADQSHFGRCFRAAYGEPPAAYRRRFRQPR